MAIERTLVRIRERSMLDVLDLALVVVRRRPAAVGLAALAGIAPFAGLNAWLFASIPDLPPVVPLVLWMAEAPFATAPLTVALGGLMFGRRSTPGRVFSTILGATVPLIVVDGLLRLGLFFWLSPRLAFANEVILLERGRWWKVLGRGGDLASGRGGELTLLGLFQVVLTYLFAVLFFMGASGIARAMVSDRMTWDAPAGSSFSGWLFQSPIWLATAFFAVARFLAYIDQRIRLEGWEVELRLREVGDAMQEARRW